jgi:hypothetical protein
MALVESILIVFFLGLFLFLTFHSIVPSIKALKSEEAGASHPRKALAASRRIFDELARSNPASVTIVADGPRKGISFLSTSPMPPAKKGKKPQPLPGSALTGGAVVTRGVVWQKFVIIYHDEATAPAGNVVGGLFVKEIPYDGREKVASISGDMQKALMRDGGIPRQVVASGIGDASFSSPRYPAITISLRCGEPGGERDGRESLVFSVLPRN